MVFDAAQIYIVSPLRPLSVPMLPMHKYSICISLWWLAWNGGIHISTFAAVSRQVTGRRFVRPSQHCGGCWCRGFSTWELACQFILVLCMWRNLDKPEKSAKYTSKSGCETTNIYRIWTIFIQCPGMQQYLLMGGPGHSDVRLDSGRFESFWLPKSHHSETYPTQIFKPREVHFFTTYQFMTSVAHVTSEFATWNTKEIKHISTPRGRGATTFKPRQPRLVTVLTFVPNRKVKNDEKISTKTSKEFTRLVP